MNILKSLGLLALVVLAVIYGGWVLTLMWDWFVIPAFGLPALPLANAIGLKGMMAFLTMQEMPHEKSMPVKDVVIKIFKRPTVVLIASFIVSLFV